MADKSETAGPYIVWENYGCYEGWQPRSYPTLKEALRAQRYNSEFVVTRLSDFEVVESWKCKAQPTAADPQDCDWPFCGCDPNAEKVLAAIGECGMTIVPDKTN